MLMKNYNIGLKLWSINTDYYYSEAERLYNNGIFDYIELYAVPDTKDSLKKWRTLKDRLKIPFAVHAPHFAHGLNFSLASAYHKNMALAEETRAFAEELESVYTVFHPGIGGSADESARQMSRIKISFIVENKPYIVRTEKGACVGAVYEDIKKITDASGCGFCLDIGHGMCSANYLGINPYEYLKKLNELSPSTYHISDNKEQSVYDKHLHLGKGTIDFNKIPFLFERSRYIAIETDKDSKTSLDDFTDDVKHLNRLYEKRAKDE